MSKMGYMLWWVKVLHYMPGWWLILYIWVTETMPLSQEVEPVLPCAGVSSALRGRWVLHCLLIGTSSSRAGGAGALHHQEWPTCGPFALCQKQKSKNKLTNKKPFGRWTGVYWRVDFIFSLLSHAEKACQSLSVICPLSRTCHLKTFRIHHLFLWVVLSSNAPGPLFETFTL